MFLILNIDCIGCCDLRKLCICHCQHTLLTDHLDAVQLAAHTDELRYLMIHHTCAGIYTACHNGQDQHCHTGCRHNAVHGAHVQEFGPDSSYFIATLLFTLFPFTAASRCHIIVGIVLFIVGVIFFAVLVSDILLVVGIVLFAILVSGVLLIVGIVLSAVLFSDILLVGVLLVVGIVLSAVLFSGVLLIVGIVLFAVLLSGVLLVVGIVLFAVLLSGVLLVVGIVLFAVLLFIPIVTILYVFFPVTVRTFCMVK